MNMQTCSMCRRKLFGLIQTTVNHLYFWSICPDCTKVLAGFINDYVKNLQVVDIEKAIQMLRRNECDYIRKTIEGDVWTIFIDPALNHIVFFSDFEDEESLIQYQKCLKLFAGDWTCHKGDPRI